jgi:hypothetical protein
MQEAYTSMKLESGIVSTQKNTSRSKAFSMTVGKDNPDRQILWDLA